MWTINQAEDYINQIFPKLIDYHHKGKLNLLDKEFDEFDQNLPRNVNNEWDTLMIILNFWDGWIDSSNHDWQYYDPIEKDDWLNLAGEILNCLNNNEAITNNIILTRFKASHLYP